MDYGTADAINTPTDIQNLAAAWGQQCATRVTDTTNGYGEGIFSKTLPEDVFNFFVQYGGV